MSFRGRILFYAIVILGLIPGLSSSSRAFESDAPCLSHLLEAAGGINPHTRMIQELTLYNEEIKRPLSEFAPWNVSEGFNETLQHLKPVSSGFPRREFMQWFEENHFTTEEWRKMLQEKKTLGEALHNRVELFERTHPGVNLEKTAEEFKQRVKALQEICGTDVECHKREITSISGKLWHNTCLSSNPFMIQGMISSLAVTNAGYAGSYLGNKGEKTFPFDLFVSNLIWSPILAEMGCRNHLQSQSQAGLAVNLNQPLTYQHAFKGFFNGFGKDYLGYLKMSPLIDASYQALHIIYEKSLGHEVDTNPGHLLTQLASYIAYDAAYSIPRVALYNDRLLMKAGPVVRQDLMRMTGPQMGKILYFIPDVGSRVFVASKSTDFFKWWEEQESKLMSKASADPKKNAK